MLNDLTQKLRSAQSVVLSTHRNCDGDGLGAQLALLYGLKKIGKHVRVLNVDRPPRKYDFLAANAHVETFQAGLTQVSPADIALILDTNDERLVEPVFSVLKKHCKEVIFIDHHPILTKGPAPTQGSVIDISAASTGELAFQILKSLGVPLDAVIARALYTSLAFDTQLFRYVRSDPRSHLIAAELLQFETKPEEIHRHLFASYTVEKLSFLARALNQVNYFRGNRIAMIHLKARDFRANGLELDESGDVIDMVMNIESVEAAALIREDSPGRFKISLRCKGEIEVMTLAESLGGGGHASSAGAYVEGSAHELADQILRALEALVTQNPR